MIEVEAAVEEEFRKKMPEPEKEIPTHHQVLPGAVARWLIDADIVQVFSPTLKSVGVAGNSQVELSDPRPVVKMSDRVQDEELQRFPLASC
jgi:hypothetical protein